MSSLENNKSVNMTIRVSPELKEKISTVSKVQKLKPSEFIRNCIQESLDESRLKFRSSLQGMDNQLLSPISTFGKIYIAISNILSADTELPLDFIFEQCEEYFNIQGYTQDLLVSLSRDESELIFIKFLEFSIDRYEISKPAVLIIKTMFISFLGSEFNSPIYSISSASLDLISIMNQLKGKLIG